MPLPSPDSPLAPDALGPTVAIGEILVEIMATGTGEGFLEPIELTGPYPSGAPAIFIDQCARMGGSAAIVGAVGDDDFGRLNVARLRGDGVDVSAVRVDPDRPTGSAFVRYREDGSRDFVFNIAHSAAARLACGEAAERLFARAGHLHVMGTACSVPALWEVVDRAIDVVRARGGSVSLDPNVRKELLGIAGTADNLSRALEVADLILPSEDELLLTASVDEPAGAVRRLLAGRASEVVVKRGAAGAARFGTAGPDLHVPAFEVLEIDPTGAGDCFGGAFVACRRLGLSVDESMSYACAAGARNASVRGPMEGVGTRAELDGFIAAARGRGV